MKKFLVWLLILFCIMLPALSEESFTLRGDITFGLSVEEVIEREKARWIELYDVAVPYKRDIFGGFVNNYQQIQYAFDAEGGLAEIIYIFTDVEKAASGTSLGADESTDKKIDEMDFAREQQRILEKSLTAKYGAGEMSDVCLNSYMVWGTEENPNNKWIENICRFVPFKDGYVVIENLILVNDNRVTTYRNSARGFSGPVWVEVTLDADTITSIKIGDERFKESSGYGDKALDEAFQKQFIGKKLPIAKEDIDAITNATITTDAMINAINEPYQYGVVKDSDVCINVVTYEYMTAEEYEYKLIETQVQDYLNGIL